jgi:hypothetical protein
MAQDWSSKIRSIGICAAIMVGASLGILAPPALAAPANDEFANRADLGSQLPVHLTESNAEATRDGYLEVGSFAKGHSIWWQWESPASQWTTVGTCDSEFLTTVGVFEGTELQHLTRLSNGNADEGPGCYASQTRYTFWAEAGHSYDIGADGNGFFLPPQEPPSGEGVISLAIEATPPPPNDAFAAALPIEGPYSNIRANPFTEPGVQELIKQTYGYNWGATAEPGEPEHAGVPGGASVWYRWNPPASGEARLDLQFAGAQSLLTLYSGSTLGGLIPLGSTTHAIEQLRTHVDAGTEYMIAVDGATSALGRPTMGSFDLDVAVVADESTTTPPPTETAVPAATSNGTQAASDRAPTIAPVPAPPVLGHTSVDAAAGTATFRFHGSGPGLAYRCKVDAKGFRGCSSPYEVRGLAPGKHRLEVRARAPGGAISRAAIVHFRVPAAQRHPHRAAGA